SAFPNCWPPSFASARYRESVATNRLHSEPNLTEHLYEEEKRRTNALLFKFFSKLLEIIRDSLALPPHDAQIAERKYYGPHAKRSMVMRTCTTRFLSLKR